MYEGTAATNETKRLLTFFLVLCLCTTIYNNPKHLFSVFFFKKNRNVFSLSKIHFIFFISLNSHLLNFKIFFVLFDSTAVDRQDSGEREKGHDMTGMKAMISVHVTSLMISRTAIISSLINQLVANHQINHQLF